jgi:hypothetical protein
MPSPKQTYDPPFAPRSLGVREEQVEYGLIGRLQGLIDQYADEANKKITHLETALIGDLIPLLTKRARGREISGLSAYE